MLMVADAGGESIFDRMRGDSASDKGLSEAYQLPMSVAWS